MGDNLLRGLTILGNGPSILYLVGGSLGGMLFGVIPGLGGVVILSVVLALINHISLEGTLCLFLAVQAASFFSASITSILLNSPAHAEAFAVSLDGFPMAQRGEAGRALGLSATSTCIGGLIGCAALVGFIQILNFLSASFHPPEFVALVALALVLVGTLGTDSVGKGLISAALGIIIACIGASALTGVDRYTFGSVGLLGGVAIVALALGCFAVPQMILIFGTGTTVARQDMAGREVTASAPVELGRGFGKQVVGGVIEAFRHWVVLIMSGLVGVVTGIIPGIGAFAANFLSYGLAQQTSKHPKLFGTGIPEGIIAPEGSSLSKEAGGIVPVIALGIPGGVGGALFLAALGLKDIKVGYDFAQLNPVLPYEMVWIIALGGVIGTVAGLLAAPLLARITRVPGPLLVPFVLALSVLGVYVATQSFFAVMEVLVFSIIGLAMRRLRYSLASFIVGLVLGPTLEQNIFLTHNIYHGFSFFKLGPSDAIFAITIVFLVLKAREIRREKRRLNEEDAAAELSPAERRARELRRTPYPLLALIVTTVLLCFGIAFTVYGIENYQFVTAIMPVVGGTLVSLVALFRLPLDSRNYVHYRRLMRSAVGSSPALPEGIAVDAVTATETPQQWAGAANAASVMLGAAPVAMTEGVPLAVAGFEPIRERSWGIHGQYTRELVCLGWLGALTLACYLFGFDIGVPAFCAAYALASTRRVLQDMRWRVMFAVISAAVMWALTYEIINALHLVFTPLL